MEMREFREKYGWRRDRPDGFTAEQIGQMLGLSVRRVKYWTSQGTPLVGQFALDELVRRLKL